VIASGTQRIGRRNTAAGFGLAELIVTIGIIGILAVMAVPSFLSYYRAAGLKAGAQQVATLINQAREIAIKENGNVCVTVPTATKMAYRLGTCGGSVWTGAGTDATGGISLPPGITITASGNPIFNYVGSALPAAVYTLNYTQTGATLTVSVAASGRVTIP
jgi:type IV fimbrial biogenesis protein FimU